MQRKQLKQLVGKNVQTIDVASLAAILHAHRNHFLRVVWESNQNNRLKKTGEGEEFKNREVTKLYVATVRNDFNFENAVKNRLTKKECGKWTPQERTWGDHIPLTPFVVHQCKDEPKRLHGHFFPVKYHSIPGETGYYVDGEKADDKKLKSLEYSKKKPDSKLDQTRQDCHPVNARLDDILYFKVGKWYKVLPANEEEIQSLAEAAQEYAKQL